MPNRNSRIEAPPKRASSQYVLLIPLFTRTDRKLQVKISVWRRGSKVVNFEALVTFHVSFAMLHLATEPFPFKK